MILRQMEDIGRSFQRLVGCSLLWRKPVVIINSLLINCNKWRLIKNYKRKGEEEVESNRQFNLKLNLKYNRFNSQCNHRFNNQCNHRFNNQCNQKHSHRLMQQNNTKNLKVHLKVHLKVQKNQSELEVIERYSMQFTSDYFLM